MSDDNAAKKLEKYKENVRENVTVLLEKTFPEKILELNELLESEKLSIKRLETIHVRKKSGMLHNILWSILFSLKKQHSEEFSSSSLLAKVMSRNQ